MQHTLESGETIDLRPVKGPNGLKAKDKDAYEAAIKLYVEFDDKGMPDMSGIPFSMSLTKLQRNALLVSGGDRHRLLERDRGDPGAVHREGGAQAGPKRDDYGKLKRYIEGKGRSLPEGLEPDELRDIMFLINYGITPDGGRGRDGLPAGVETWLTATQICLNRIQEEASAPNTAGAGPVPPSYPR